MRISMRYFLSVLAVDTGEIKTQYKFNHHHLTASGVLVIEGQQYNGIYMASFPRDTSEIKGIIIKNTSIESFDPDFAEFTALTQVRCESNSKLVNIDNLFSIPLLKSLTLLGSQSLKSFKLLDNQAQNLSSICFIRTGLVSLPDSIFKHQSLEEIKVTSSSLAYLPEILQENNKLSTLEITSCRLSYLPKSISKLKSLSLMNLEDNAIVELPDTIGSLNSLKVLILTDNLIRFLPASLENIRDIQSLTLCKNYISFVPKWLTRRNFKIDMRNNPIESQNFSDEFLGQKPATDMSRGNVAITPANRASYCSASEFFKEYQSAAKYWNIPELCKMKYKIPEYARNKTLLFRIKNIKELNEIVSSEESNFLKFVKCLYRESIDPIEQGVKDKIKRLFNILTGACAFTDSETSSYFVNHLNNVISSFPDQFNEKIGEFNEIYKILTKELDIDMLVDAFIRVLFIEAKSIAFRLFTENSKSIPMWIYKAKLDGILGLNINFQEENIAKVPFQLDDAYLVPILKRFLEKFTITKVHEWICNQLNKYSELVSEAATLDQNISVGGESKNPVFTIEQLEAKLVSLNLLVLDKSQYSEFDQRMLAEQEYHNNTITLYDTKVDSDDQGKIIITDKVKEYVQDMINSRFNSLSQEINDRINKQIRNGLASFNESNSLQNIEKIFNSRIKELSDEIEAKSALRVEARLKELLGKKSNTEGGASKNILSHLMGFITNDRDQYENSLNERTAETEDLETKIEKAVARRLDSVVETLKLMIDEKLEQKVRTVPNPTDPVTALERGDHTKFLMDLQNQVKKLNEKVFETKPDSESFEDIKKQIQLLNEKLDMKISEDKNAAIELEKTHRAELQVLNDKIEQKQGLPGKDYSEEIKDLNKKINGLIDNSNNKGHPKKDEKVNKNDKIKAEETEEKQDSEEKEALPNTKKSAKGGISTLSQVLIGVVLPILAVGIFVVYKYV